MCLRYIARVVVCASLGWLGTGRIVAEGGTQDVVVGDAYVCSEAGGSRWRIGSQGIEQVLECSDGRLRLASYQNKLTEPATEYVASQEACAPFALDVRPFAGCFSFENIWHKMLEEGKRVDPADDKVSMDVKRGELVGFCVQAESDDVLDDVEWTTKVAYEDGPIYLSSDGAKLEQGPEWFYYQIATGSGCIEELGEVAELDVDGKNMPARVATGYRAPFETHCIGATFFAPRNFYTLVRAWKAWQRKGGAADGCFVALDYLGTWNISLDGIPNASEMVSVSLPTLADYPLAPGETLELPVTTTGMFHRNLDDMAVHLYDWQYQYLWDYANADYYAKSKWAVAWFACARNLQEQFTAKIAHLNMDADVMRAMGFDCTHDDDMETLRLVNETYDYLKHEGVVGRWSFAFHPRITGDDPIFYLQRSNFDHTKACIVLRHWSPAPFTVYPVELLPEHAYVVGFESAPETTVRKGADLMEYGIEIKNQKPGELIYLGLPDRPSSGEDAVAPQSPGRALSRYEVNAGYSGIGVYWSPGSDNGWISYYEIRRDSVVLGKTVTRSRRTHEAID